MPLWMKMGGSFFFKKHLLAQPLYDLGEKVHPKHYAFCALCILLCFIASLIDLQFRVFN